MSHSADESLAASPITASTAAHEIAISPPFRTLHHIKPSRAPQRDSLASTASHTSTLPLYQHEGAPPPDYDSSASPVARSSSKERHREGESVLLELGPSAPNGSRHADAEGQVLEGENDVSDPPDALDLLIARTSSILLASESILASTLSSRAQLARFFALDETLHQRDMEGTLRLRMEGSEMNENGLEALRREVEEFADGGVVKRREPPVERKDPRELLKRQSRGHPPRVATQHEEAESWNSAVGAGSTGSPMSAAALNIEGATRGDDSPSTGSRMLGSAVGSLIRSSSNSALGSPSPPSPHRRQPSQSASSLLASIASSSKTSTIRRVASSSPSPSPSPSALLRPSGSAASLNSILESSSSHSHTTATETTRRLSSSTNPTSPDLASSPPRTRGFLAIHENDEEDSLSTPSSSRPPSAPSSPLQRGPPSSRIRHTRASASLSLSTAPLPSSLFASPSHSPSPVPPPPPTATPPSTIGRHRSSSSVSRPPPSPSPSGHGHSSSRDDLSRVHAEATRHASPSALGVSAGGGGSALRERLQAAAGGREIGEKEDEGGGAGGAGGGWWWSR